MVVMNQLSAKFKLFGEIGLTRLEVFSV